LNVDFRKLFLALPLIFGSFAFGATKEILFIAGPPSHGALEHEQNAAAILFAGILNKTPGFHATVSKSGWPDDPTLIEKADGIWIFCDGGNKHLINQSDHERQIAAAAKRGAGLMFYHYATEAPATDLHPEFLGWIGGYFELNHSVNPVFEAEFKTLPKHPITRGVQPFQIKDEWYYNIRFADGMKGVTPILVTVPPASSLSRRDGPHENNPDVRSKLGQPQVLMWAYQRPGGGRGVGYTGGHFHLNLGDDNIRKVVLNAIVWMANGKIPANGIESHITHDDLMQNLDKPAPKR
jgi:type 1 glutamine amidotransferase